VRVVEEQPCAVGTASLFRSRAMAYAVLPSVRSRTTRATTSSGVDLGRPRTTPWSRRTASASRVRLRMKSRESSAKTTAMCAIALPIGVPRGVVPSHGGCRLTHLRFPGW
jgi:transposase